MFYQVLRLGIFIIMVGTEWLGKLYPANDDEIYMLDSASAVKSISRLSCQIIMTESLDGLTVTLAAGSEKD